MDNREQYVARVRQERAAKERLIVPGSRWRHRTNRSLVGTVDRVGVITIESKDGVPRVWLTLDGTFEEYRCSPAQLVGSWVYVIPEAKPAPPPKPAPPKPAPPAAPSDPAQTVIDTPVSPGVRKATKKRRTRKGR